jgi:xanthine dehydrogenase large subunit
MFLGQPLVMILATDPSIAEEASSRIQLQYEELKPILEIEEADLKEEWYIPERRIVRRNPQPDSLLKLNGRTRSEAQEHFYMETQRSRTIPLEDKQIIVHTATQSTMECQEVIAHVLGIPAHNIIIEVPRLGGAFGGKERNATIWATMAALGAYVSKRPVEVLLPRDHDMKVTGKRHPFLSTWNLAYSPEGRVRSYDIERLSNGGAYADLSIAILERALFHAENIYNIPDISIRGRACRTNLPPNTAFRGFGAPQESL